MTLPFDICLTSLDVHAMLSSYLDLHQTIIWFFPRFQFKILVATEQTNGGTVVSWMSFSFGVHQTDPSRFEINLLFSQTQTVAMVRGREHSPVRPKQIVVCQTMAHNQRSKHGTIIHTRHLEMDPSTPEFNQWYTHIAWNKSPGSLEKEIYVFPSVDR